MSYYSGYNYNYNYDYQYQQQQQQQLMIKRAELSLQQAKKAVQLTADYVVKTM